MEATLYILIKKYPSLAYFDIRQAITEEQLLTIAPEIN